MVEAVWNFYGEAANVYDVTPLMLPYLCFWTSVVQFRSSPYLFNKRKWFG